MTVDDHSDTMTAVRTFLTIAWAAVILRTAVDMSFARWFAATVFHDLSRGFEALLRRRKGCSAGSSCVMLLCSCGLECSGRAA